MKSNCLINNFKLIIFAVDFEELIFYFQYDTNKHIKKNQSIIAFLYHDFHFHFYCPFTTNYFFPHLLPAMLFVFLLNRNATGSSSIGMHGDGYTDLVGQLGFLFRNSL